ncbi:uncharacterized protein BDW70DRAFT_133621 [Aspergillus foveolatus]|uniref:uncharacterized protein n=1 Tax=Aspergillus foveolatus TaxID=210207 RepID=UPI003CCCD298
MARGYGSSRYGGLPSCSEYAFEMDAPRIDIAFAALYFIVTLVLLIFASVRIRRSKKQGQHVAGAVFLNLSIIFAWFAYIVTIIYTILTECDVYNSRHMYQASVLDLWLRGVSEYLLLAAILISISRKLQTDFGLVQPAILTAQKVWAVLVGLVLIAVLSINTAWYHYYYKDTYFSGSYMDLAEPQRAVRLTYHCIAAAGMLLASATLGKTLSQAPGGLRSRGITVSIILLVIGALGFTLTNLGNYVQNAFTYSGRSLLYGSSEYKEYLAKYEAASFLWSFFYCMAFYAAVRVASQRVNAADMTSAYAPPPPPSQPPMTFMTGNEGYRNSGPAYYHNLGQEQGYGRNPEYVR